MPRTSITRTELLGPNAAVGVALNLTAADTVNLNAARMTGNDILIAQNTGASAYTVTVTSKPDERGRTGDIAAFSIPAGGVAAFGPLDIGGWQQPDGNVYFQASNAAVKFAVLGQAR